ncbi:hypothetical protein [Clostridium sp. C2-6-12]|uniref:hypothetical protein n=1 Tax=Clostridium sp. C2-6-12 TaxID=2698832 RepID=UPI00136D87D7|nr:hypothetical protein [Clostridium sp. C2-6-12]
MELKIDNKNNTDYSLSAQKVNNSNGISFSETLKEVSKSYFDIKKDLENGKKINAPIIDNLPKNQRSEALDAIDKLDKIFDIDILGNPDQFIRADDTINVPRILSEYGGNVTSFELNDLSDSINKLYECGLISNEDYFSTLKWIATQKEATRIKMTNEKNYGNLVDAHNDITKNKVI